MYFLAFSLMTLVCAQTLFSMNNQPSLELTQPGIKRSASDSEEDSVTKKIKPDDAHIKSEAEKPLGLFPIVNTLNDPRFMILPTAARNKMLESYEAYFETQEAFRNYKIFTQAHLTQGLSIYLNNGFYKRNIIHGVVTPVNQLPYSQNQLIAFANHQHSVICGDSQGNVHVIDVYSSQKVQTIKVADNPIVAIATSADGQFLAVSAQHSVLKLYSLNSTHRYELEYSFSYHAASLKFSPKSSILAVGKCNGTVALCTIDNNNQGCNVTEKDVLTITPSSILPGAPRPVTALAFSTSGNYFAAATYDAVNAWKQSADHTQPAWEDLWKQNFDPLIRFDTLVIPSWHHSNVHNISDRRYAICFAAATRNFQTEECSSLSFLTANYMSSTGFRTLSHPGLIIQAMKSRFTESSTMPSDEFKKIIFWAETGPVDPQSQYDIDSSDNHAYLYSPLIGKKHAVAAVDGNLIIYKRFISLPEEQLRVLAELYSKPDNYTTADKRAELLTKEQQEIFYEIPIMARPVQLRADRESD